MVVVTLIIDNTESEPERMYSKRGCTKRALMSIKNNRDVIVAAENEIIVKD